MGRKAKTVIWLFGGSLAYLFFFQAFYDCMKYGKLIPVPGQEMVRALAINFFPLLFLVCVNYLIVFKLKVTRHWIKYAIDSILSFIALILLNLSFILISGMPVEWAGTVFSNVLILVFIESLYYEKVSRDMVEQQALAKQEILRYQFEALKAQVDPHFLFNSLNILYSIIPPQEDKTRDYVLNLSRIYRYTLNQSDKTEVTLKEELSFLESYMDIMRIRYNNNFNVEIKGIESYEERLIIPYTLQMLVENVTKHNVISTNQPLVVKINADEDGIWVRNVVQPKEAQYSTRIGTTYLSRLYACHNKRFAAGHEGNQYVAKVPYLN